MAQQVFSVAELCQQQSMTVEQLVEKTGLEQTRVMAILMGRWTPSPAERDKVAAAVGVAKDVISWGHKTPIQHIYGSGPG